MSLRRRHQDEVARSDEPAELAALADGSLAPERRARLEERVADSPELAQRLSEQRRAVALVQSAADGADAPSALRARVDAQRRARRPRPAGRLVVAAAGAAAIAAAVAIGLTVLESEPAAEGYRVALAPTEVAGGAAGEATLTKTASGWRIELAATGLPRLAEGRFYEAWLLDRAGVLVPIGTFNEGRSVTLWAGVSPREFPTLTVTREQADDDQASSGERVLVGTVDVADSR